MKKILMFGASAIMMLLAACGSGHYDQKVVDELIDNKENYSEKDYKTMVEQLGYALDDAEGAKDLGKWEEENEQKAVGMMGLYMALNILSEQDSNFPESLQKDVKSLSKRVNKLTEKVMTAGQEAPAAGFDSDQIVTVEE